MISKLLKKGPTSKMDVLMAAAGALVGVWKAVDTYRDYKSEQEENHELSNS